MSAFSEKKFRMNEGDWICSDPQCGNVNFARRSTCNRCGKAISGSSSPLSEHHNEEKSGSLPQRKQLGHEIGKAAAEKSRGLFSADDWQCGRCGNVNWARRQQCNMCNAPKYGEVEERTGLGGGYNERENIEYIEREESDGEYDDFGRKKKKFRGNIEHKSDSNHSTDLKKLKSDKDSINRSNFEPELEKEILDEEEDEDDDDEEDGEDLSKYDFSDWGDTSPKKQTNDKNSRSRSSSSVSRSSSSSSSSSSSRSRSLSQGSQSSSPRSRSRSRSTTPTPKRHKRANSRSRSSSYDSRSRRRRRRSRSSSHSPAYRSRSRDRERSGSKSPKCRKR